VSIDDEALARLRLLLDMVKEAGFRNVGIKPAELSALLDIAEAVARAATGEVVEVGDDDEGQPRVLIHSTRDELRKGSALAFKRVSIVPCTGGGE